MKTYRFAAAQQALVREAQVILNERLLTIGVSAGLQPPFSMLPVQCGRNSRLRPG